MSFMLRYIGQISAAVSCAAAGFSYYQFSVSQKQWHDEQQKQASLQLVSLVDDYFDSRLDAAIHYLYGLSEQEGDVTELAMDWAKKKYWTQQLAGALWLWPWQRRMKNDVEEVDNYVTVTKNFFTKFRILYNSGGVSQHEITRLGFPGVRRMRMYIDVIEPLQHAQCTIFSKDCDYLRKYEKSLEKFLKDEFLNKVDGKDDAEEEKSRITLCPAETPRAKIVRPSEQKNDEVKDETKLSTFSAFTFNCAACAVRVSKEGLAVSQASAGAERKLLVMASACTNSLLQTWGDADKEQFAPPSQTNSRLRLNSPDVKHLSRRYRTPPYPYSAIKHQAAASAHGRSDRQFGKSPDSPSELL
uniref:Uncharacterized protein n=1 Tax=Branchiostoma floridae TaxID=7739 RepID=C3YHD0_BRAFL|eukprot:XP_002604355.1 hypothetical protein BRAFLDRAFT_124219 [Branchiostoma floridae]